MRRRGPGPGPARMAGRRMAVRMTRRRRRRRRRRRIILVGGLIAVGSHKLSKKQVEQVEQHTGKTAEDLTEDELDQAMADLNIEAEEMSDAELDEAEKADDDYIAELERIADLHEKGILSDEEYAAKKQQLLGL